MMAGAEEDYEHLAVEQRLKAAVHYSVGELCKSYQLEDGELRYSKQFIAVLSEATYKYACTMASDLEAFAKHGKRANINVEDVKLLVRKSRDLHAHISDLGDQLTNESEEKKAKAKKSRPKKNAAAATVESDGD